MGILAGGGVAVNGDEQVSLGLIGNSPTLIELNEAIILTCVGNLKQRIFFQFLSH